MKAFALRLLPFLFVTALSAQTITLYSPQDPVSKKYDEGKATFSFKYCATREVTRNKDWQLGYGFLSIGEQDWFTLKSFDGNRTVIKDLGQHTWEDSIQVPVLEPLPELPKGERRKIEVDASADTHKKWAETTSIFAKATVGHMYVVHIKDESSDFYAMFRVEELEPQKHCTISWRLIPTPAPVSEADIK